MYLKKNHHDYFVQIRILLKFNVSLDITSELRARQNCPDLLSRPHLLLRNLRLGVWTWTSDLNHWTSIKIKHNIYYLNNVNTIIKNVLTHINTFFIIDLFLLE